MERRRKGGLSYEREPVGFVQEGYFILKDDAAGHLQSVVEIGQIGIGYWGPNLLRNIVSSDNCEVRCVVDLSSERREFVHDLYPSITVSDEVENIINDKDGRPHIDERYLPVGLENIDVSISHTSTHAISVAILNNA